MSQTTITIYFWEGHASGRHLGDDGGDEVRLPIHLFGTALPLPKKEDEGGASKEPPVLSPVDAKAAPPEWLPFILALFPPPFLLHRTHKKALSSSPSLFPIRLSRHLFNVALTQKAQIKKSNVLYRSRLLL